MAETTEQWYTMLQETYDKWSGEVQRLQNENEDGNLTKQINQILPTLEKYKYYLDKKPLQEPSITQKETQQEKLESDLIQLD